MNNRKPLAGEVPTADHLIPSELSPEETGIYLCPGCGNTEAFVGHDDRGYPGDECECGHLEGERDECVCKVTLSQRFTVLSNGEPFYEAFEGGGRNSNIGEYTRIDCARCGKEIWREPAGPPLTPPAP